MVEIVIPRTRVKRVMESLTMGTTGKRVEKLKNFLPRSEAVAAPQRS